MKKILLLTLFILLSRFGISQEAIEVKPGPVRMHVHNVCYNAGVVVVCDGNDSLGIHPSLGYLDINNSYQHSDSLLMDKISFFDIDDVLTGRIVLGNSNTLVSYYLYHSPMNALDTLFMDSIMGTSISNNKIYVLKRDSLFVFDTLSNNYLNAYSVNFSARFVSSSNSNFCVTGVDGSGQTRLILWDNFTSSFVLDTTLGNIFNNPVGLDVDYSFITLISAPGDSAIYTFKYNYYNQTVSSGSCYSGSGPHCLALRSGFYFQPESDPSINGYEFSLFTGCSPSNINGRLKAICPPASDTYYPYFSIVVDTPNVQSFILLEAGTFNVVDTIQTALNPLFIVNDFRCPIKVFEYDDSKVEWKIFPNPSSANTSIDASGLICGRDYKLDITDMNGKILYETTIHAKTSYDLPIDKFPKGVYFVRIYSLKGLIVQKLIKS